MTKILTLSKTSKNGKFKSKFPVKNIDNRKLGKIIPTFVASRGMIKKRQSQNGIRINKVEKSFSPIVGTIK